MKEAHLPRTVSAPADFFAPYECVDSPVSSKDSSPPAARRISMPTPKAPPFATGPAADTDIDSDSTASFGESLRSSPYLVIQTSPILQAVAKQFAVAKQAASRQAEGLMTPASGSVCAAPWLQCPVLPVGLVGGDLWAPQLRDVGDWMLPPAASADESHIQQDAGEFMLPGTAWSGDGNQDYVDFEMHIDEGTGCHGHAMASPQVFGSPYLAPAAGQWVASHLSSPNISCPGSPVWSLPGSPVLVAKVGQWTPAAWQTFMQQQISPRPQGSQQSSPVISPQASPMLGPQMSPGSPMLGPCPASPPMAPLYGGPVAELNLSDPDYLKLGWPDEPLRQNTVTMRSNESGVHRFIWTVASDKLNTPDRVAVSPPFHLERLGLKEMRLSLHPKPQEGGKGSASFKKSNGEACVELKCEKGGKVSFNLSISNGTREFFMKTRGTVIHDFADNSTCKLKEPHQWWQLNEAINQARGIFCIVLDIIPTKLHHLIFT